MGQEPLETRYWAEAASTACSRTVPAPTGTLAIPEGQGYHLAFLQLPIPARQQMSVLGVEPVLPSEKSDSPWNISSQFRKKNQPFVLPAPLLLCKLGLWAPQELLRLAVIRKTLEHKFKWY